MADTGDWLGHVADEKARVTPGAGFNVVLHDTFAAPDEVSLVVVQHCETREEAEDWCRRLTEDDKENNGGMARYYVYDAETR